MTRNEERRLADALRLALQNFETRQREALAALKVELVAALWPTEERTES